MLKLLQSIFGSNASAGRYPEALVEEGMERVIDGIDPRLRLLSGYRKRLREPVMTAIDQVIRIVEALPSPVSAATADFSEDALLSACFVSADSMRETLGNDPQLDAYRSSLIDTDVSPCLLLLVERCEKNTLGVELCGEMLRNDVVQISVSFRTPRVVEVAADETELRRQLKRRAFDYLIQLALQRIGEVKEEKDSLGKQRGLLQAKHSLLRRSGMGFEQTAGELAKVEAELVEIDAQLQGLNPEGNALESQLAIAAEVLGDAAQQLRGEHLEIHLDRMNIRRNPDDEGARKLALDEIGTANGQRLTAMLLTLPLHELPPRKTLSAGMIQSLAELGGAFSR
jgi:hypothetical protein